MQYKNRNSKTRYSKQLIQAIKLLPLILASSISGKYRSKVESI